MRIRILLFSLMRIWIQLPIMMRIRIQNTAENSLNIGASVLNQHRVDDDPDPNFFVDADPRIGIKTMSIHMRILHQVLRILENREILYFYSKQRKFTIR
jgi:hypothetical protein